MINFETEGVDSESLIRDLFAPLSVEDFLSKYWLKTHLYCPGHPGKFARLISWPVINQMLESHWRETYRFRLVQEGKTINFDAYADRGAPNGTPKIRSRDVTDLLRRGATLDFDAIDELHPPLNSLARSLESFFRGSSKINIYAGWAKSHGLNLHRDDQDNFILQIDGHKRWLLYGRSIEGIDTSTLAADSIPPAGAEFDELLRPGDLLYVPRGVYHLAIPQNEPTYHLTVSVKNRLGKHLISWIGDQLSNTEIASRDVPRFTDEQERARYVDELRDQFLNCLTPDLLERYFYEIDTTFKARPSFSLPWSATHEGLPAGDEFQIVLTVRRYLTLHVDDSSGAVEFSCHGRNWRFPAGMKSIIEQLNGDRLVTMRELIQSTSGCMNEGMVRILAAMLVKNGLAAIKI